eukprot:1932623-Prymnesium_polylepis.1
MRFLACNVSSQNLNRGSPRSAHASGTRRLPSSPLIDTPRRAAACAPRRAPPRGLHGAGSPWV